MTVLNIIAFIAIIAFITLMLKLLTHEPTDEEIKDDWRHRWFTRDLIMKNRFECYSDSALRSFSKDELIKYIRFLQENLQMRTVQYERAVEANGKMSECIPEEKRKEIQNELFKKWGEEENDR